MLQRTTVYYPWENCSYGHATTKNEMCGHATCESLNGAGMGDRGAVTRGGSWKDGAQRA